MARTRRRGAAAQNVPHTDVNGRPLRTSKSAATKVTMLNAAREVFERRGYGDTRVADIVKEAGTAHGTFYRYFKSKEDIFRALAELVRGDLLAAQAAEDFGNLPTGPVEPSERDAMVDLIRTAMARYLHVFRENVRLIELLEEVATYDALVRRSRIEVRERLNHNTSRFIRYLITRGFIATDIDPDTTGELIGAMTDRAAYMWFALGSGMDHDKALDTLLVGYLRLICWPGTQGTSTV